MLDKIKEALEAFGLPVCYGSDARLQGSNDWDYIVFRRSETDVIPSAKTDLTDRYEVYIVRQDFVPEGEPEHVLDTLVAIKGIRPVKEPIRYSYMFKPDTKAGMEVASFTVLSARKRA